MRVGIRGRLAGLVSAIVVMAGAPVVAGPAGPRVAPGFDLFTTLSGTRISVDLDGPGPEARRLMSFSSEPLRRFDFGDGPRDVGAADTVVRRLEAATPADGLVPVELVGLQLRSVEPAGYFATLQSDRGRNRLDPPDAVASPGLIDIRFAPDGLGGTFHVEFLVNYDIRHGSVDGPIVGSGSSRIQGDDGWTSARSEQPQATCHGAGGPVPLHQHCVVSVAGDAAAMACGERVAPIPAIRGVNSMLNGRDQSADFHPGHATSSDECGAGGGQTCALDSRSDGLTAPPGQQSGLLRGTFVATDAEVTVTLGCTVQVNAPAHAGPDTVAKAASGAGGAAVTAHVTYAMTQADTVYVCTQVSFDGGAAYYYDAPSGEFSTSSGATCASSPVGRPPNPDTAPGACGTGGTTMTTSRGLYDNLIGPSQSDVQFVLHLTCPAGGESITGVVHGGCYTLTGSGEIDGRPFEIVGAGSSWRFSGPSVQGFFNVTPAPGESCVPAGPGADRFVVSGTIVY